MPAEVVDAERVLRCKHIHNGIVKARRIDFLRAFCFSMFILILFSPSPVSAEVVAVLPFPAAVPLR